MGEPGVPPRRLGWMESGLLARLTGAPAETGIVLDVDGTLAPIVLRPEDAEVPPKTKRELERLANRYALVACVSGRTGDDAARLVGVEGVVYVGVHGLELDPRAAEWRPRLHAFAAGVGWPVEDKGVAVAFHYRAADDEAAARAELERVAERARAEGLDARFGRKVLEVRPPVEADKGEAVRRLLAGRGLRRGVYAGDDTTDLDAFRGLSEAGLDITVRVAVASTEAPPQLVASADLVVDGPAGVLDLLRSL